MTAPLAPGTYDHALRLGRNARASGQPAPSDANMAIYAKLAAITTDGPYLAAVMSAYRAAWAEHDSAIFNAATERQED